MFTETRNHRDSDNVAARSYLPYINDIVKKAILLDTFGVDQNKLKSHNSLLMHSMYAVVDIGKGPEVLKLYVEEMNNPNVDNTTKRSYQLQNIEKYHPAAKGSQKVSPVSAASDTIKTIADMYRHVNQQDSSFKANPPSKVANVDGTPKKMNHGTSNSGFTVFDTYGGNFGLFGKGSYFTDNPEVAMSYTKKGNGQDPGVYGVYLSIKNPLDMDAKADLKAWEQAFDDAGLDPSYMDGVVTNEDAFRQLKENLVYDGYVRWEAEDIVTKNKKRHPVLGEFGYITGDTRKVVVVNIQEALKVSIYDPRHSSFDNEHGWLDKYGWESRKTYVLTKENIIYEAYLKNC